MKTFTTRFMPKLLAVIAMTPFLPVILLMWLAYFCAEQQEKSVASHDERVAKGETLKMNHPSRQTSVPVTHDNSWSNHDSKLQWV